MFLPEICWEEICLDAWPGIRTWALCLIGQYTTYETAATFDTSIWENLASKINVVHFLHTYHREGWSCRDRCLHPCYLFHWHWFPNDYFQHFSTFASYSVCLVNGFVSWKVKVISLRWVPKNYSVGCENTSHIGHLIVTLYVKIL